MNQSAQSLIFIYYVQKRKKTSKRIKKKVTLISILLSARAFVGSNDDSNFIKMCVFLDVDGPA